MRGAATKAMSDIVEERQQRRYAPFAAPPLRAAARRPAGFVARSSHTAPGIARRSRLASGPGGQQQNVNLFLREPLMLVIWRRVLDVDDLFAGLRQDRGKRILFYQLSQSLERLRIISGLMQDHTHGQQHAVALRA